jgi:hypothetical protein
MSSAGHRTGLFEELHEAGFRSVETHRLAHDVPKKGYVVRQCAVHDRSTIPFAAITPLRNCAADLEWAGTPTARAEARQSGIPRPDTRELFSSSAHFEQIAGRFERGPRIALCRLGHLYVQRPLMRQRYAGKKVCAA